MPDQVLDDVCVELIKHLRVSFDPLNSTYMIKLHVYSIALRSCWGILALRLWVTVDHTADWWLGDLTHHPFLSPCLSTFAEPLSTRLVRTVPFLKKSLGCSALHLPMGQSPVRWFARY